MRKYRIKKETKNNGKEEYSIEERYWLVFWKEVDYCCFFKPALYTLEDATNWLNKLIIEEINNNVVKTDYIYKKNC